MTAAIITIGDEILIGQINDTNSTFIAERLTKAGVQVCLKTSIGDEKEQIKSTLTEAMKNYDVIITTGGLGPTKDDITKHTIAEIFNCGMRKDEKTAQFVREMLEKRGFKNNALNEGQSEVPECCQTLHNAHGTAPGMWFDTPRGGALISLAGVPFEMRVLMDNEVIPRLKSHFELKSSVHTTLITSGIPESLLAITIEKWEDALPSHLRLAYLPNPGSVRLRLSAYNVDNEDATKAEIEAQFDALKSIIGDNIIGYEGVTIEQKIHQTLCKMGKTLAVAESCTGGSIASKFTAMAGASEYFMGGVVSYSNKSKCDVLGVNQSSLEEYGAVSEQVARQMAEGVRKSMSADFSVATTGIAGPTGGSDEKPIGTVWFAASSDEGCITRCLNCGSERSQIIERATREAIILLQELINQK